MSDNVHRVVGNLLVGTSHFFVDTTTNRVGVNTSSPSASLDIATGDLKVGSGITIGNSGTITATAFDGDGSLLQNINSDSGSWVNGTSSNIHLAVSTDKVGIGTVDPSNSLHIYKAAGEGTSGLLIEKASGDAGTKAALFFGVNNTNENPGVAKAAIFYERNLVNGRGDIKFCNDAANDANPVTTEAVDTRMIIKNNGDVGMGTVTPQTTLHVHSSDDSTGTGDAFVGGLVGNTANRKPTECLRLQGQWRSTGSGALLRFTNYHGGGTNPNTYEYNTAGIAGFDYDNNWGGGLVLYTALGTAGGGDLKPRMIINNYGHTEIIGHRAFDGSTILQLRNDATQYGRTQLKLIGRYEANNDTWSAGGARNAIMFQSQSSQGSAITNQWTIQSFPHGTSNDLGFMSGSNDAPRFIIRGNGSTEFFPDAQYPFKVTNQGTATDTYNFVLNGPRPGTSSGGATHFINGSTRSHDGGTNTYTIRNDSGPLRLGAAGFTTSIPGPFHVDSPSATGGRVHINRFDDTNSIFTGLYGANTDGGRAQLVLSSAYSDLVIASSRVNHSHGSTLSFATYNPSNSNDYRKFVINQGNWGNRKEYLDFGLSHNTADSNPHLGINGTDTVLTLDGTNKRVGIGKDVPAHTLDVNGNINIGSGNKITIDSDDAVCPRIKLVNGGSYSLTSGAWTKLCDFGHNYLDGAYAIKIEWDYGHTGHYWAGMATGIVPAKSYTNVLYHHAPIEYLELNHFYHHRAVSRFDFALDSDAHFNANYGRISLYVYSHSTATHHFWVDVRKIL